MRFMLLALVLVCAGCNTQTGISPTETVIKKSSDRDFHFAGTWLPVPQRDQPAHPDLDAFKMVIERGEEYTATIRGPVENQEHVVTASFRAVEISKDHPHAIVEVTMDGLFFKGRYLAVAAVQDDRLYLWAIDGRKLGEHLYNSGQAAVIEHFAYHSQVRCPPDKLLETIRAQARGVIGEVQVFHRQPKL
jgi:hypothetical protein